MELAAAPGLRHQGRLAAAGHRPGRRPGRASSERLDDRRGLPALPRPRRDRARIAGPATARSSACARSSRRFRDSPERQDAVRLAADRLGLPAELQAGLAPAARTGGAGASRRRCSRPASGWSATRSPACIAHPELIPLLAELTPEHFDLELHRRVREQLLEPASSRRELVAVARRARRARGRGGDRRGDRQGAAAAAARARASGASSSACETTSSGRESFRLALAQDPRGRRQPDLSYAATRERPARHRRPRAPLAADHRHRQVPVARGDARRRRRLRLRARHGRRRPHRPRQRRRGDHRLPAGGRHAAAEHRRVRPRRRRRCASRGWRAPAGCRTGSSSR